MQYLRVGVLVERYGPMACIFRLVPPALLFGRNSLRKDGRLHVDPTVLDDKG